MFLNPGQDPTLSLSVSFQFTLEMVETLYDCAKFRFECGNYSEAAEYLYFYRILVTKTVMAFKLPWFDCACLPFCRHLLITRT